MERRASGPGGEVISGRGEISAVCTRRITPLPYTHIDAYKLATRSWCGDYESGIFYLNSLSAKEELQSGMSVTKTVR